jgi:hypothetical protein
VIITYAEIRRREWWDHCIAFSMNRHIGGSLIFDGYNPKLSIFFVRSNIQVMLFRFRN